MTDNWRHTHLRILCLASGDTPRCAVYWPTREEWRDWAVGVYRASVKKAETTKARGPMLVSSSLAVRAALYGWDDLFRFWAEKAHSAGDLNRESVDTPLFKKLRTRLALDERIQISGIRFRQEYERAFGYPVHCSPLANACYEEEMARAM